VAAIIFGLAALLFVYHLFADRLTPFSSDGYVRAYLVEIAPEVSGLIADVPIRDNQRVKEGEVLFRIDTVNYEIATAADEGSVRARNKAITLCHYLRSTVCSVSLAAAAAAAASAISSACGWFSKPGGKSTATRRWAK